VKRPRVKLHRPTMMASTEATYVSSMDRMKAAFCSVNSAAPSSRVWH